MTEPERRALPADQPIPDITAEEMVTLAQAVARGEVYVAWSDPDPFRAILMLGGLDPTSPMMQSVGAIYEYMSAAGPLSVNDQPAFMSARFLNHEDRLRLIATWLPMAEMLGSIGTEHAAELRAGLAEQGVEPVTV